KRAHQKVERTPDGSSRRCHRALPAFRNRGDSGRRTGRGAPRRPRARPGAQGRARLPLLRLLRGHALSRRRESGVAGPDLGRVSGAPASFEQRQADGDVSVPALGPDRREHAVSRGNLGGRRLARARAVRSGRNGLRRTSRPAPFDDAGGWARPPAPAGVRDRNSALSLEMRVGSSSDTLSRDPRGPSSAADPAARKNGGQVRMVEIGGVRVPYPLTLLTRPDPYLDIQSYHADADLKRLNMGPQHPSAHGVLRVKLYLDGETCVKAVPYLGYLHRGVEKLCEKLTYVQITPIVDKNDYVSPMMNELAINMAFEALLGIEVPIRARYIRTICAEIQRVASHLLWLGTFGLDVGGGIGGGATLFMHTFRERETCLDLFENLTGCRFHYNTHQVGGNRHDIPEGWDRLVDQTLSRIADRVDEYEAFVENP